jgi:hypothetical protein
MAHEYYGVAPEVAMEWRRDGTNVRAIMTREYHAREHDDRRGGDHDEHARKHHHD